MISVSKRIYNVQYCCGTWERNDSNPGSDILPSHMRLRPSQLWVWICVPLPQMNLQGHEMEMPRPLMVITLKIHFTFLIYFKMWNRIEACPTTPLSWHLDTDINSKLCWPNNDCLTLFNYPRWRFNFLFRVMKGEVSPAAVFSVNHT